MPTDRHGETGSAPLVTRIAVTLGALLAYRAGLAIPLPGIQPDVVGAMIEYGSPGLGIGRVSLFALGVVPLLSAYVLAETLRLMSSGFGRWQAEPANDRRLQRWLRGLALAFAAVQGLGIASALEGLDRAVAEPGWTFRLGVLVSLVAATAVISWLADLVSRHGVVNGFWLLAATPAIVDIVPLASEALSHYRIGRMSDGFAIASIAYIVLGTAALVGMHMARRDDVPNALRVGVWPPVLAYTAMGWIAAALTGWGEARHGLFAPGQPGYLVLLALLIMLFAVRHGVTPRPGSAQPKGAGASGDMSVAVSGMGSVAAAQAARAAANAAATEAAARRRVRLRLACLAGLAQIAICVTGDVLGRELPVAISGMWLIVVVALALAALDAVRGEAGVAAPPPVDATRTT